MFIAVSDKRGWRVKLDLGEDQRIDICGAINEVVARQTAAAMNDYRRINP